MTNLLTHGMHDRSRQDAHMMSKHEHQLLNTQSDEMGEQSIMGYSPKKAHDNKFYIEEHSDN